VVAFEGKGSKGVRSKVSMQQEGKEPNVRSTIRATSNEEVTVLLKWGGKGDPTSPKQGGGETKIVRVGKRESVRSSL